LGTESLDNAINELKRYKEELLAKEKLLMEKLADIGVGEATIRFVEARYDGVKDVNVTIEETNTGYAVVAKGNAVAFIEFGAGVYHNPSEPYPEPRPEGIVGIGEYGKKRGNRRAWFYYGDAGTNGEVQENGAIKTRGNPAAMPMWYASEEMKRSIKRVVKEVFG
jgi:hypothetical protein